MPLLGFTSVPICPGLPISPMFPAPARPAIERLARTAPAIEDLAESFPAMLFAIATGYGTSSGRDAAVRAVMDGGEIVEDAPTAQFFEQPRSERAQTFLSKILPH